MARPKNDNVQINISIPNEWKTELENLARIYSDVVFCGQEDILYQQ